VLARLALANASEPIAIAATAATDERVRNWGLAAMVTSLGQVGDAKPYLVATSGPWRSSDGNGASLHVLGRNRSRS
jgi:hypothetical protein